VGALQVLQAIGSALGALSAAFLVYDRAVRGRPIFALHAEPGPPGDNHLYVRLVNVLDEAVIVEDFRIEPGIVALSEDHEVRSVVEAQFKNIRSLVLPARASATYVLIILGAATGRDAEGIVISADWRRTQRAWPWKRRVHIRTKVAELKRLKAARTS
jgi:hypothetical protein